MLGCKFMITVTEREWTEQYLDFFKRHGAANVISKLCAGTSTDQMLDLWGLEKTDKVMYELVVRAENEQEIKNALHSEMNIGGAGNGIAFFIPIDSVGGESALKYLAGDTPVSKTEAKEMESKFALIISVMDKGYAETAMEAARAAGATGGTIVRAKGTGAEMAKFFGVSISEEKEMLYIVSDRPSRDGIMRAVMEKVGSKTDAHGVVFTLPVDSVCGIRRWEEE